MLPRISIALATFNGEKYIAEQLQSLAIQSELPMELVVCDDGSEDRTLEIIAEFSKGATFPVHVHRNEQRLGYRANFMKAASLCSGELIAFCDQDDVWDPAKLKSVSGAFRDPNVLLAYHNAWVTDAELALRGTVYSRKTSRQLARRPVTNVGFYALGHSIVFRSGLREFAEVWEASRDPSEPSEVLAHDQWFCFLAMSLGRLKYVDAPLVFYRQHSRNTYGVQGGGRRSLAGRLRNLATRWMSAGDWYDTHQAIVGNWVSLLNLMLRSGNGRSTENISATIGAYQKLSQRLATRAEIYCAKRPSRRFELIFKLARGGAYNGGNIENFSRLAAVKDLAHTAGFTIEVISRVGASTALGLASKWRRKLDA